MERNYIKYALMMDMALAGSTYAEIGAATGHTKGTAGQYVAFVRRKMLYHTTHKERQCREVGRSGIIYMRKNHDFWIPILNRVKREWKIPT